jgi:AhpD family alkylhydroperoxidase
MFVRTPRGTIRAARNSPSEDEVMEPQFNMFDNEIAAKFAKRFANASLVIHQSPLPKSTRELVSLRASQINGCGWCVDMHTKEAAAAGETAVRINLVAAWREATVFTEAERAALALAEEGTRLATPTTACPTRPGPRYASTTTTTRSPRWSPWSP